MTDIKFCGLTRPEDAAAAADLGAAFVGVIFAGGPRHLTAERAAEVLSAVPATARRVGVFGARPAAEIAAIASSARLDVIQLHGGPGADELRAIRHAFGGELWAVARVAGDVLPEGLAALFELADAVVLDSLVSGKLGGSGMALPWKAVAPVLEPLRRGKRVVLGGGLRTENVAEAIARLSPDVVDVSSGVESAPGIKDHARMRAFRDAVVAAMGKG